MEKFNLLMKVTELAERAGKMHYLFHDLAHDMPVDAAVGLKKRMEELRSRGYPFGRTWERKNYFKKLLKNSCN